MSARTVIGSWIGRVRASRNAKKYHFIHIPKNGGVSVRAALELRGDVSVTEPYHYRYIDIADQVGRDLRFFCIVRNPWSRTASRYLFGKQDATGWPVGDQRREYITRVTFETFVREQRVLPIPNHPGKPWMGPLSSWLNQLEWIRDEDGKVACDCLRLEHVEDDIRAFFGQPIRVPRGNATKNPYDYRAMYSDELAEVVAEAFREDIEYFGFTFEGSATRNIFVSV